MPRWIDEETEKEVKTLRAAGHPYRTIGQRLQLSYMTVVSILTGIIYARGRHYRCRPGVVVGSADEIGFELVERYVCYGGHSTTFDPCPVCAALLRKGGL